MAEMLVDHKEIGVSRRWNHPVDGESEPRLSYHCLPQADGEWTNANYPSPAWKLQHGHPCIHNPPRTGSIGT